MQPKLLRNRCFFPTKQRNLSNVLSNAFYIDIDYASIARHIVIVLSPSPTVDVIQVYSFNTDVHPGCLLY
ncbi:hypothetical protein UPYG_G00093400 [Umbra pygmaea]|uniref:Uncharacterized protein n=1 Tax=Umbra pygmaea TaxID=75934 RepID=A0ABD0WZI9_UMBPY